MLSTEDASAQLSSATLNGVVRDSTGAVIKNASVVLRNLGTSVERITASNDTGNYVFSDVTPGPYTLKVSAQSFATKQVSEFVLAVNQTASEPRKHDADAGGYLYNELMNARTDSVLRVGIDRAPPVPLQNGSPEAGNFCGYEVAMLQEIATRLNFTIRYRKALWSVIIDELSGGALDLICSAATVTAEREQRVNFCIPYLKLKLAFVVCAECNASLDLSTSRIGVRSGTTAERYLLHRSNGRKPSMLSESNEELYSALQKKMLDSVIDDSPIARHFSQTMPELKYGGTFDGTEAEYAVMTRAGNTVLRDQISSTISSLEGDGTLPSLRRRWFGSENLLVA